MRQIPCLRCGTQMAYSGLESLQFGRPTMLLNVPYYGNGRLELEIYVCPGCGKLEFFLPEYLSAAAPPSAAAQPQRRCPRCGNWHDFDDPKCPFCGFAPGK